jgi:hypothetical protein
VALKSLSTSTVKNTLTKSNTFTTGIVMNGLRFSIHADSNLDSNNTIPDLSGNGYNATKTSALTTNSSGYWDFGITNHIDKYILIPKETILNATNWSIEFWISPATIAGRYWFHAGGTGNRHLIGPASVNNSLNTLDFYIGANPGAQFSTFATAPIADNGAYVAPSRVIYPDQLHHVVFTYEPNLIKAYVDGNFWTRSPLTDNSGAPYTISTVATCGTLNNSYWFGQELDSDGESAAPNQYAADRNQSFIGKLHALRMYGKTLSDIEIIQNFKAGVKAK